MRRFLISSKKYTGVVEVVYGEVAGADTRHESGILYRIDFGQAQLTPGQVKGLKELIPALFSQFEAAISTTQLMVVEEAYEVSFDDYWRQVKKKVNRKRCELLWARMGKVAQVQAVMALPQYYKYLAKANRKEADPETYLSKEYFLTEWQKI
jgi:hypothetical protein